MFSAPVGGRLNATRRGVGAYVQIARPDHWFKNSFMIFGMVLALFYRPDLLSWSVAPRILLAVLAVCIVASSNYVLNELLDGPRDAAHPEKRFRPVPSGRVNSTLGYIEWIVLAAVGLGVASLIGALYVCAPGTARGALTESSP